jgi:membrane peptidoglycan carboxypeptidase
LVAAARPIALLGSAVLIVFVAVFVARWEAETSSLQSLFFTRTARDMTYAVESGPSSEIRFPHAGPYDERLGYARLSSLIDRLSSRHFEIERQARQSATFRRFVDLGGYPPYHEKTQAGLVLRDRSGAFLERNRHPDLVYNTFDDVPGIVGDTLRYIEDRDLLDAGRPTRNPAVEWRRFLLAAFSRLAPMMRQGGGSTLATQIEKFRHSPAGRTDGVVEKFRQMASASIRAYADGAQTLDAQRAILTAYLNSTPLGSRPNYGEVIGIGEGLRAWYGTDFAEANRLLLYPRRVAGAALAPIAGRSTDAVRLTDPERSPEERAPRALVYKQILSLLIAERRPSYYLGADGHKALRRAADTHLRLLAAAGVIDQDLCDAALTLDLAIQPEAPTPAAPSFVARKATDAVRTELMAALGVPGLYAVDRLDLTANATIDTAAQNRVAEALSRLKERDAVKAMGLIGDKLLGAEDPAKVAYSFVLYERGKDRNYVRVHADSLDQPFDINSGAKLILGSTAKLRTLVTYLGIVTELHGEMAEMAPADLRRQAASSEDPLRRWAAEHLASATANGRGLQASLDAAMKRSYSGNPDEAFFTGGGVHIFHNFEKSEDFRSFTVEEGFVHSVNLVFIRLLRDIIRHYEAENAAEGSVLADHYNPAREEYLRRFADQEGASFLNRFYAEYKGKDPEAAVRQLAARVRPLPRRLAIVFRSVRPDGSPADLGAFLKTRLPNEVLDEDDVSELYRKYAPSAFSLNDRGFLAKVNPLELWLVSYLQDHPNATRSEMLKAGAGARQDAYSWLFKTRSTRKQDIRIRILIEEDAFDRLLQDWRKVGYPFERIIPSYATAIGSSGDSPEALALLMGIILNRGVQLPTTDLDRLHFASGTPYETVMTYRPAAPLRVMASEVAATVHRALGEVVAEGTGTRLRGAYLREDGAALPAGGKTGTGDNRFETFGAGHTFAASRAVDRTATFVFFLGDRFYGTVTAYVAGKDADAYHFTSALAVSVLKGLAPEIKPLLGLQR